VRLVSEERSYTTGWRSRGVVVFIDNETEMLPPSGKRKWLVTQGSPTLLRIIQQWIPARNDDPNDAVDFKSFT
jgi:hypothetical protein